MKTLIALLLLAIPVAHATDVTLNWTVPTANTDGTVPAVVGGYNIYSASSDAALTALPNTLAGGKPASVGNVLTYTFRNVLPGKYVYAVTAWNCPTAATCVESAQSAHVTTTVMPATPGVPGSVKITVTVSAP